MNLITRVGSQPSLDSRMLVGSIVIYDKMDCHIGWHAGIDLFEELQVFLMAVSVLAGGKYLTISDIQRSK